MTNCLTCSSATTCTECKDGFWLKETSADTGLACSAVMTNCDISYS
jgi:hypothetical protein